MALANMLNPRKLASGVAPAFNKSQSAPHCLNERSEESERTSLKAKAPELMIAPEPLSIQAISLTLSDGNIVQISATKSLTKETAAALAVYFTSLTKG